MSEYTMQFGPTTLTGVSLERQTQVWQLVCDDPFGSFIFSGPAGVGKTVILKEQARAVRHLLNARGSFLREEVYAATAYDWQHETSQAAAANELLLSQRIYRPQQVHVFLDDIDKVILRESLGNHLHALLDKLHEKNCQFCATTNMSKPELQSFFGDNIYRRITEGCKWVGLER